MYFHDIKDPKIIEEIKQLPKDKIFQYRFGHDKKLDELQDERFNKKAKSESFKLLRTARFKWEI